MNLGTYEEEPLPPHNNIHYGRKVAREMKFRYRKGQPAWLAGAYESLYRIAVNLKRENRELKRKIKELESNAKEG